MEYNNDPQCLLREENSIETWKQRRTEANVELSDAALQSRRPHGRQQPLQAVTLRNIRFSEKLFLDYGLKFRFNQTSIRALYNNRRKWKREKFGCMRVVLDTES